MEELKTLREDAAKTALILNDLRQKMTYVETDLASFAALVETDQTRDLTSAASVALHHAGFAAQRLSFRLEGIYDSIRIVEEREKTAKLVKSHAALMAAFDAAIAAADQASKL
jgi:CO dehydrogenase/acetyl-CoA synthase alpha subunit